jgi:hypothetical protein
MVSEYKRQQEQASAVPPDRANKRAQKWKFKMASKDKMNWKRRSRISIADFFPTYRLPPSGLAATLNTQRVGTI